MTESNATLTPHNEPDPAVVSSIPTESLRRGFEVQGVNFRTIIFFAAALVIAAVLIHVVLWGLLSNWMGRSLMPQAQIPPAVVTVQPAPGPFPVSAPSRNLQSLVDAANAHLHSYGWVDQKAGVVRIPIDQAMQLLVQRGLPARQAKPPQFGLDAAHRLEGEGGQPADNEYVMK